MTDATMTLAHFDAARQQLALARDIDEVKTIRDQAEALRQYVRQQGASLEMQNHCAEIKLRAERRAGEMLRDMDKNTGGNPNLLQRETGYEPPTLSELGISRTQSHRWQIEASVPEEVFERHVAEVKASGDELTSASLLTIAKAGPAHVSYNSGNNEWYTPPAYIMAARMVMGDIDLDPASSDIANRTVGASTYYTQDDNGLMQEWTGRAWMNPPYASELIGQFTDKLARHFANGDVSEAIVLVNNATETNWFQGLLKYASAVCFPSQRIRFIDVNGNASGAPLQGQAVLYLGNNLKQFAHAFSPFGVVLFGIPTGRYQQQGAGFSDTGL